MREYALCISMCVRECMYVGMHGCVCVGRGVRACECLNMHGLAIMWRIVGYSGVCVVVWGSGVWYCMQVVTSEYGCEGVGVRRYVEAYVGQYSLLRRCASMRYA